MTLHPDWRKIMLRAWSVRLMIAAALLGGIGAGLQVAQPYLNWNPVLVAGAVGLATMGSALAAVWARLVHQDGFDAA